MKNLGLGVLVIWVLGASAALGDQFQNCYAGTGSNAVTACNQILAQNPQNKVALYHRGLLLLQEEATLSSGLKDLEKAVSIDPAYMDAYVSLGDAQQTIEDYSSAIKSYSRVISLNESYKDIHNSRGLAHLALKQYYKAIEDFTSETKIDPGLAWAWGNRCNAYLLVGNLDVALSDCNKALYLQDYPEGRFTRGVAFLKSDRLDEAIADFNKALQKAPNLSRTLYALGVAKLRKNELKEGNADIAKAKAQFDKLEAAFKVLEGQETPKTAQGDTNARDIARKAHDKLLQASRPDLSDYGVQP